VGFSIPINLARWAMNQLVTVGRVSRGAIGYSSRSCRPAMRSTSAWRGRGGPVWGRCSRARRPRPRVCRLATWF
jgi:S1-C subfamily serine protease